MTHKGTITIETPRLILRRFRPDDAGPMFRNWANDPVVTSFLTWPTHSDVSVTQQVVDRWVSGSSDPTFYQWAIELKEIGEPIGSISAMNVNEVIGQVEVGYCIGRKWWHRGIVSEAFSALIPFLFEEVGVDRIQARHAVDNPHSGMVMKKCGLTCEGTLRQAGHCNRGITDLRVYSILRSDYEARKALGISTRTAARTSLFAGPSGVTEGSGAPEPDLRSDLCLAVDNGLINIRVGAIIMKDGRFLMVSNSSFGYLYSVGGRIKFGETAEEAVIREVFEETGVRMEVDRLGFVHECFFIGDTPAKLGRLIYEISFFFYMKTPDDFEPVCGSFTEDGAEEYLTWASIDDPRYYFPEFFRTELKAPSQTVKHFVTDERVKLQHTAAPKG